MEIKKASRKKFETEEQCMAFIENLSLAHIKNWLCDFLMEPAQETTGKIIITQEQFNEFFRIRQDSGEGRKGRPKKMKED